MRLCKCGGKISTLELTNSRDRWECKSCGRYEIFDRSKFGDQSNQMLDSHELNGDLHGQAGRVALLHHPDLFDSQD
jgi:hypothetical protein